MQFNAARTAHICISERQNNLFNTKGQKHEGWLNPLMWFWKWYKNDLHTNVHLSVLGFRVSSPFVLASLRPEEAVCSIYVRPRCEGDAENVPWACSAEQSDMTGCQRPNKPWPKYQRVWHETGSRGHDVCVCVSVRARLTWIRWVQLFFFSQLKMFLWTKNHKWNEKMNLVISFEWVQSADVHNW